MFANAVQLKRTIYSLPYFQGYLTDNGFVNLSRVQLVLAGKYLVTLVTPVLWRGIPESQS